MLFFLKKILPLCFLAFVAFFCNGFITLIGMIPPLLTVVIFDYTYPYGDLFVFTAITLITFVIYFLDFIFSAHIDYINIYVHQKIDYDLTLEVFEKIQRLPVTVLNRIKIGDLTVRLTSDVGNVVYLIVNIISDISMSLIRWGIFLYVSLSFDYKITLMALLSIPLYLIETKFYSGKQANVKEEMQQADSDVYDGIQTKLLNIRTTKAFNQQMREASELGVRLKKTFILSIKESIVTIVEVFTNSFTIRLWGIFIMWYLGYEVIGGRLTIGEVVALGIYVPLLEEPIRELAGAYNRIRVTGVSINRLKSILDADEEESTPGICQPVDIRNGEIRFENVSFSFEGDTSAVKDFSLNISAKSSMALVGESGSGKSTILNMLMRFYQCQNGRILIDGFDTRDADLASLRESMGVVFQETAIVPGTIRDNILYGIKGKPDDEIIKAAIGAGVHEFIQTLPNGYDTEISAGARGLSGGQQQRLAIARVLLRDPKIFILDEPTSALDAVSEFLIQDAINRCLGSRTVIIVAHRLSIVRKVDNIVVMSKGKIVEQGTFDDLMKKHGHFFTLYNLQFGGFQKFIDMFDTELQRVTRYGGDLSLAMLEIGQYHGIVQRYHPNIAAKYMEEVDLLIKKQIRVMDFSAVYTGDKIVLAVPETGSVETKAMLVRLNKVLTGFKYEIDGVAFGASMRAGIVSCKDIHARYGEDLFDKAAEVIMRLPQNVIIGSYGELNKTVW